jgi:Ca2+-binding RTX toxin-like protein
MIETMANSSRIPDLRYTIDLTDDSPSPPPTPFISFVDLPDDSNEDGWGDTVLKINLNDPSVGNPYKIAQFQVVYGADPTGMSVNIGDSETNNGFSGDWGTQSNDAEMQIGTVAEEVGLDRNLAALGNDSIPPGQTTMTEQRQFVGSGSSVKLTVGDRFLSWDNGAGAFGSLSSPYLYALNGQTDTEGPINYDIFAGFNRSIDGTYRPGTGVTQVSITLRSANNQGTSGSDIIYMSERSGTQVTARGGDDFIFGSDLDESLVGEEGADIIDGRGGNDWVIGGDGKDWLIGGEGSDSLRGANGSDTLTGWGGGSNEVDRLNGNASSDTYILGDLNIPFYTANGSQDYADIVTFEARDRAVLHGMASDYSLRAMRDDTGLFYHDELIAVFDTGLNPAMGLDSRFVFTSRQVAPA